MTSGDPLVELMEVDAENWRAVSAIQVAPDQQRFVAHPTYYLCLCLYGGDWRPLAVVVDGRVVGHMMWAVDEADGSHWIGGMLIDAHAQRRGYGRAALSKLLVRFTERGAERAALSYHPDNTPAAELYRQLGFVETGELEGDEVVARLQLQAYT